MRYFAAQNSYNGFISHFSEIFKSEGYNRIFVLKGGPGTGKSSLMKRFSQSLSEACEITEIYCSSDVRSLDGVIAQSKRGRVAILDGTAPHERDAVIAGAVDELVNLGEHWDTAGLIERREEILEINREKSKRYKDAYYNLSLAGRYYGLLRGEIQSRFDSYRAKEYVRGLISGEKCDAPPERSLLFSAFGKDGYRTLENALSGYDRVVQISGEYSAPELLIKILCEELRRLDILHEEIPSPLSNDITECVVIPKHEGNVCYTLLPSEEQISANQFLRSLSAAELQLKHYEKQMLHYEQLSVKSFGDASRAHFALENIYTPLMNFDKIGEIGEKIIEKTREILE